MLSSVVFGGQYGSEGKGAFCAHLARTRGPAFSVRAGGPQAGHTFFHPKRGVVKVRQVPIGAFFGAIGYIGPGAVIDPIVLQDELQAHGLYFDVWVHPGATLVDGNHRLKEQEIKAMGFIPGSTCEGTGAARADRALRLARRAGDLRARNFQVDSDLSVYNRMLDEWLNPKQGILVEGCQGFGLSFSHGPYPFTTSTDTTPAALLAECGLPYTAYHELIAVCRTYPIRVAGNSGPLDEITFEEIGQNPEFTTVTKKQRRIGRWDDAQFQQMLKVCQPDSICLSFADYLPKEECEDEPTIQQHGVKCRADRFASAHDFRGRLGYVGIGGPEFEYADV